MVDLNMDNERDEVELNFYFPEETKESELQELKRKRNEILMSLGYIFDEEGNLVSENTQMFDGILGFTVADALGVPAEASSREALEINPVTEMMGFGRYDVPAGTWSDDTSMMLATMDSLVECDGINFKDMMKRFVEWADFGKYSVDNNTFDVGVRTRNALRRFKRHVKPLLCGGFEEKDNGNGSLMRMLPVAYYLSKNDFPEEREIYIVNDISSLTHAHHISCLGCVIYCDYVKQLLNGKDKYDSLEYVMNKDYKKYYDDSVVDAYSRILNGDIVSLDKDSISSSGYVVDTLEACLWSTLTSESYEEAVTKAVNLGRDTDTIGALTGGLNGIIYGKEKIPNRWLNGIRNREYLESMGEKFTNYLYGMRKQEQIESDSIDLAAMLDNSATNSIEFNKNSSK